MGTAPRQIAVHAYGDGGGLRRARSIMQNGGEAQRSRAAGCYGQPWRHGTPRHTSARGVRTLGDEASSRASALGSRHLRGS